MKKILEKTNEGLCLIERWAMVLIFIAVMIIMTTQIIMRYIFNNPLVWSEEFCRFGYVWITWIGCAYCTGINNHVRITIVYDKFPQKVKNALYYICNLVIFAILAYIIPYSFNYTFKEHRFKSGTLRVPMSVVYISLGVGLIITAIQLVIVTIIHAMNKEEAK